MALKLEYEVVVDKPIEQVWDYSNNPDNLRLWLNDFLRYEPVKGDRKNPKVGDTANMTYSQGKGEFTMLEEIIAYDAPRHIKLLMTSKLMDMEIVNDFEEVDANRTRLFAGAEFIRLGLMMKIMFFVTPKKKMQADHKKQIDKLKALIEESAPLHR